MSLLLSAYLFFNKPKLILNASMRGVKVLIFFHVLSYLNEKGDFFFRANVTTYLKSKKK